MYLKSTGVYRHEEEWVRRVITGLAIILIELFSFASLQLGVFVKMYFLRFLSGKSISNGSLCTSRYRPLQ